MSMDMITRAPYCHKIRYGVTGAPALTEDEMEGSHRPGTGLDPTLIELIYSPARDGKPATVSASVTGWWMSDGEVSQPQQSVATHFRNGPDGWPGWLAEEVRLHNPAPAVVPAAPGSCGHRSTEGHSCGVAAGHLGYHRNVRLDGFEWTSWVGEVPVVPPAEPAP